MTKELFDELATDILEAIEDDINTIVTVTSVRDGFDPLESEAIENETSYANTISSPLVPYDLQYVDGSTVLAGDTMCFVPAKGQPFAEITLGDRITHDNDEWLVEGVQKIHRTGSVVGWMLQLRGKPEQP